jgi:hypothetical protein
MVTVPLPGRRVGDLVEECRKEGIGIEIVVDRDPMDPHAPLRRTMVAELRAARPDDTDLDRLPSEQRLHMASHSRRQP